MRNMFLPAALVGIVVILAIIFVQRKMALLPAPSPSPLAQEVASPSPSTSTGVPAAQPTETPTQVAEMVHEPVPGFVSRITTKPFGLYVSPQSSPVDPERFTGYHCGADAEYADVTGVVPVVALAAGTVVRSGEADGYGGFVVIRHTLSGATYRVIYGHLKPYDLPVVGDTVAGGQRLGELGAGYSSETDNERRHLHLGIHKGDGATIKGYVQGKQELDEWVDPASFFVR